MKIEVESIYTFSLVCEIRKNVYMYEEKSRTDGLILQIVNKNCQDAEKVYEFRK